MKHTFLFLMLLLTVPLQAQDVFEMEEFIVSDDLVVLMNHSSDNEITALTSSIQGIAVKKYNDDGLLLDSILLWPRNEAILDFEMFTSKEGQTLVYYLEKQLDGDTATFNKVTIGDDMIPVFEQYDWYGFDCPETVVDSKEVHVLVNKDGGCFLSYSTVQDSIRIVRFDAAGEVAAERTVKRHPQQVNYHGCIPTSDSMGIHIVKWRTDTTAFCVFGCYTFDSSLNLVNRVDDVNAVSRPIECNYYTYHRFNPNTEKTYSISSSVDPLHPEYVQNIVMSMFDRDMNQMKYTWGMISPLQDNGGGEHLIDFDSENRVYMVGAMDLITNLYIACLDEDLNKLGEIHFVHPNRTQLPIAVMAFPDGGCLVSCRAFDNETGGFVSVVYKVTISDFLDVEEAHSHGFTVATAYPNPGKDVLNIRTGLQDAWVEVYDLNGRLVHRQAITENMTGIDATNWAEGVYVWKVMVNDKLAETGKWIKD